MKTLYSKKSLRVIGKVTIPTDTILYLQSDSNYTILHTLNTHKLISGFTLKIWEDRISDDNFLRINKGTVINRQHVSQINFAEKDAFVLLSNGSMFPISRRKLPFVKESFEHLN